MTRAVFFDVDFTLIFPGPTFQGEGYRRFCAPYGVDVDPARFDAATAASAMILDGAQEQLYNHDLFVQYTASIIEHMGGSGPRVEDVALEIYEQWASNHHFEMYDDAAPALKALRLRGFRIGVISNSHRSLEEFRDHFSLRDLIDASVSSSEHGYMKPHRSIFDAALKLAGVEASASVMVGDSMKHDIEGALSAGMGAVLLRRSGDAPRDLPPNVAVIRTLTELAELL